MDQKTNGDNWNDKRDYRTLRRTSDISELQAYGSETSPYESAIVELIHRIIESGRKPDKEPGWIISHKERYYEKDQSWGEDEISWDYYIFLDTNGNLFEKENYSAFHNHYKYHPKDSQKDTRSEIRPCSLEETMLETDFEVDLYIGHEGASGSGYVFERTTCCSDISSRWERGTVVRKGTLKGINLFYILSDIYNQPEASQPQKPSSKQTASSNPTNNDSYITEKGNTSILEFRKLVFIGSFIILAKFTVLSLINTSDLDWVEDYGLKVVGSILFCGAAYGLNYEKGFRIKNKWYIWMLILPIVYAVCYSALAGLQGGNRNDFMAMIAIFIALFIVTYYVGLFFKKLSAFYD